MIGLKLSQPASRGLHVLCLGSHSDDIEIGCGGSLLRLAAEFSDCTIHWVVFSAVGVRAAEAAQGAKLFTRSARLNGPRLESFRDGFMPFMATEVKTVFEEMKAVVSPDLIFTHNRKDAHQDHRLIAELTWNTFRDHTILEYEIPKYDGDLGQPGVFVTLTADTCRQKIRNIMEAFPSQQTKLWFREDTFLSLMRLRGMECNSPSGYAEAFYCRKLTL